MMRRVLGLVVVCGAASCFCASAAPLRSAVPPPVATKLTASQKAAATKAASARARFLSLAPADEYFGPLKQSVIGINNTIRSLGWNYDVNHDIGDRTVASAALTERAIMDWYKKYPKDDQLPKSLFLLQRLYTKVLTQQSRDHSRVISALLFKSYANSPQAKQLKKTLAVEHLAPIPPPTPTPSPAPTYQSIFGPAFPSQFQYTPVPAAPASSETPPTSNAPSAAPSPALAPSASPPHTP